MGRKILGILNIVAGAIILVGSIWMFVIPNFFADSWESRRIIYSAVFLLVAGTSLTSGILVLKRRRRIFAILAAINLTLAGFALFVLLIYVLFALFPT